MSTNLSSGTKEARKSPRMSINKLGEYMVSKTTRRKIIVRDQKFPKDFKQIRYSKAKSAMVNYFKEKNNDSIIVNTVDELVRSAPNSKFKIQDRDLSVALLNDFLKLVDNFDVPFLKEYSFKKRSTQKAVLFIEGVKISVYPDVEIIGVDNKNREVIGGIKFVTSKTHPIDLVAANYITTTLHQYLDEEVARKEQKFCQKFVF